MDIIFKNFLIPNQIFFSQQVKRSVIISNKHEFGDKGVTTEVRSPPPAWKRHCRSMHTPPRALRRHPTHPPQPRAKSPAPSSERADQTERPLDLGRMPIKPITAMVIALNILQSLYREISCARKVYFFLKHLFSVGFFQISQDSSRLGRVTMILLYLKQILTNCETLPG